MYLTLKELKTAPIAKTDVGFRLYINGFPEHEFLVVGTIKKIRAGLFFLDIEGNSFTTSKREGFTVGEQVVCVLNAKIDESKIDIGNNNVVFVVRGVEKKVE